MFVTPKQTGRSSLLGRSPVGGAAFSGRRSLQATPRGTPSIATKVARAEHILEETDLHVVKALNYPVPVQVQESLKANHRETSIKLHQNGWAWLISGGKLLLWKYVTQQLSAQCYQLRLPGHGWSVDLVTVYQRSGTGEMQLSVLACSTHGGLFYWANILRDTAVTCEGSVDVGEGSGFSVSPLPDGLGCLVATTAANLYLVVPPSTSSSQMGLSVRHLQLPHGMLSGIGRKMSFLFFGASTSDVQEARKVEVVERVKGSKVTSVFLLTNTNLQKWHVDSSSEQLMYDAVLMHLVKEAVLEEEWVELATPLDDITVWVMDMQLSGNYVAVLFAMRCEGKPTMEHGLALFKVDNDVTPHSVDNLIRLNHRVDCPSGREQMALEFSLHGAQATPTLILHNRTAVLMTNINASSSSSPDVIKFPPPDVILGTGCLSSQLLLFTLHQGVLSLSQPSPVNTTSTVTDTTKTPATLSRPPSAMLTTPTHSVGFTPTRPSQSLVNLDASIEALKNAFSEYLDGNLPAAQNICERHFPPEAFYSGLDTIGDLSIVQLSEMVLDDPPPTSDPHWTDTMDGGTSGASLILIYRLEQKFQAHSRYIQFVIDVGLLDRLTCVHVRGRLMPTRLLLCEHAEKVQAAITLRKLHNQLVDQAIKISLQGRSSPMVTHPTLTKNDVFYTHLSLLEDIFPALLQHEEEALSKMDKPKHRLELIVGTGNLLDSLLHDAIFYRQSKSSLYQSCSPEATDSVQPEFLPWTASDSRRGTRNCLMEQLQVMLSFDKKDFPSSQEKKSFWSLYVRLLDLLCDGYTAQLKALEKQPGKRAEVKKTYESQRHKFLLPLLESNQFQHAVELGEKYEDFHILVYLCEELDDKKKLQEYMTRFTAQGFSDFLFKQYLDKGKLKKLLSFSEDFPQELSAFLTHHDSLSWLHHTAIKKYGKAYKALERMASSEMQYVAKKKTLLSLSKLSLLASGEDEKEDKVKHLNEQLHHIEVQQSLPSHVLEGDGLDPDLMPPLPPSKIIELYVGEDNPASEELQFIMALHYLDFAFPEREESRPMRAYVWSHAVLKDDWSQLSTDDPLTELQNTFFFRVVEEAFRKGLDMLALLPDLNSLLDSPQLRDKGLSDDPAFRLLMKAGYEQVARVQSHIATYASTGQELSEEAMT